MPRLMLFPSQLLLGLVTQRTLLLVMERVRDETKETTLTAVPFVREKIKITHFQLVTCET